MGVRMIPDTKKVVAKFLDRMTNAAFDTSSGLLRSEVHKSSQPDGLSSAYMISTCVYFYRVYDDAGALGPARRLAKPLARLISLRGGLGTDGAIFLFDTLLALQSLWRFYQAAPDEADWPAYFEAADRARSMAAEVAATHGNAVPEKWNSRVAPYLLKIYPYLPEPEATAILGIASGASFAAVLGGDPAGKAVSTLDVAYAVEGLLQHADTKYWQLLNAGHALTQRRNADGGLSATGEEGSPSHAGLTAQAARLWASIDAAGFEEPLRRAMSLLEKLFEDKGVRQDSATAKYPVIATLQALQARAFVAHGPNPVLLV